jgi:hypothetical protein
MLHPISIIRQLGLTGGVAAELPNGKSDMRRTIPSMRFSGQSLSAKSLPSHGHRE